MASLLGKEIHLKHKAPVIAIHIIDGRGYPISDAFEEEPKGLVPPQRVLICSEEQLKVGSLSLSSRCSSDVE